CAGSNLSADVARAVSRWQAERHGQPHPCQGCCYRCSIDYAEQVKDCRLGRCPMSLSGLLLGLVNIAIVVVILLLIGAVILWFCSWLNFAIPGNVQKLYVAVVALIALYMLIAIIFGIPSIRLIGASTLHPG